MPAAASGGDGAATPPQPVTPAGEFTFPPVDDFTKRGPFMTTVEAGGLNCTVFRPQTMGEEGRKHPVVIWGNGTFNTPVNYTELHTHFASHGFIIAAANTSDAGNGQQMLECLDYVIKQNGTAGPFQDKVDLMHIMSSGYSQGAAGAMMAGRDPRFTVLGLVSPFTVIPLGGFDITSIGQQVHPIFMISGAIDTVATPQIHQAPVWNDAKVPIVWATFASSDHLEVLGNGGRYRGVLTAWYRYRLMNDPKAEAYFTKNDCGLCKLQGWTVKWNDLWKDN